MNRFFGRQKPKEPPPSLSDCIANVSQLDDSSGFQANFDQLK